MMKEVVNGGMPESFGHLVMAQMLMDISFWLLFTRIKCPLKTKKPSGLVMSGGVCDLTADAGSVSLPVQIHR